MVRLTIAMPFGAITVKMTKQGIKNGFLHGWAVGIGGMTVDYILIFALYFGIAKVLVIPFIQMPLWIIRAFFLFFYYDSIKNLIKILIWLVRKLINHSLKYTEKLFLQGI